MVTVFGLGFVGLTTALGFAHMGYQVYGVDVNDGRKGMLRQGKLPFYEPYMEEVLKEHLHKNFCITEDVAGAIKDSEFVFFCVGTPYGKDGSADLTYLFQALDTAIDAIHDERFRVMVVKSTVPPGTTAERVAPYVRKKGAKADFISVANNPEFLREGHCWEDFIHADRIVLGCDDDKAGEMLKKLYEPMQVPVRCVSCNTGEFIKYLSNTMLATMISYSNEMAQIADGIGNIETAEAFRILHMDRRWDSCQMTSYVYPGCGYGGYCLPKDTNALLARAREAGCEPAILREVISVNDNIAKRIAEKIINASEKGKESCIGILGLSFKPGSDDVRDTPAARIIRELAAAGCEKISVYDPMAKEEFGKVYPELAVTYFETREQVYKNADVLAIVTAWEEFRSIKSETDKPVVDCRYLL